MKMLKSIKHVDALQSAVSNCRDSVILKSANGSEEYNLKSVLSQLIGISRLCEEYGDEYEFFCTNRADEGLMLKFFRELKQSDTTVD